VIHGTPHPVFTLLQLGQVIHQANDRFSEPFEVLDARGIYQPMNECVLVGLARAPRTVRVLLVRLACSLWHGRCTDLCTVRCCRGSRLAPVSALAEGDCVLFAFVFRLSAVSFAPIWYQLLPGGGKTRPHILPDG